MSKSDAAKSKRRLRPPQSAAGAEVSSRPPRAWYDTTLTMLTARLRSQRELREELQRFPLHHDLNRLLTDVERSLADARELQLFAAQLAYPNYQPPSSLGIKHP